MLSQERQFILGRSSDDPNFFFRKHHSLSVEIISKISIQDTFNAMCPDDDLSLSFSSILDEDLLHLALLCGLVQYSFDKGRAWWLATTQPNRGEVQLYHGVFAKYVTDRYYGISYGLVCSGKVQQRALYRCEWSSADGDANAPQQLSSHPGGPAVTSLNILWLAKFWKGHWQTSENFCEWKTLSSSHSPY